MTSSSTVDTPNSLSDKLIPFSRGWRLILLLDVDLAITVDLRHSVRSVA